MEFNYSGIDFCIKPEEFEPSLVFNDRAWFIAHNFDKWDDTWENLVQISKIWSNIKYKDAKYNSKIHDKLDKLVAGSKYQLI